MCQRRWRPARRHRQPGPWAAAAALVAEVVLVMVYDMVDLVHPSGGRLSVTTLTPHSLGGWRVGRGPRHRGDWVHRV